MHCLLSYLSGGATLVLFVLFLNTSAVEGFSLIACALFLSFVCGICFPAFFPLSLLWAAAGVCTTAILCLFLCGHFSAREAEKRYRLLFSSDFP